MIIRFFHVISLFLMLVICMIPELRAENAGETALQRSIDKFCTEMIKNYSWSERELRELFRSVEVKDDILKAFRRPSTKKSWYEFREIFVTKSRTKKGVDFWKKNRVILDRAFEKYGVPPEIIVAVIGVETIYGTRTGSYRVIDSLYTLGFVEGRRSRFFKKELENFLLLSKENNVDLYSVLGSFAGAMGVPQFMPSSYREYAVDFDHDKKVDLWGSIPDAIGSVANYLSRHGWKKNKPVTYKIEIEKNDAIKLIKRGVKPRIPLRTLKHFALIRGFEGEVSDDTKVSVFKLQEKDREDYWISFHNFYAITRYNPSYNYAMAVFELSNKIKLAYFQE